MIKHCGGHEEDTFPGDAVTLEHRQQRWKTIADPRRARS
jgi:hypothetical protein